MSERFGPFCKTVRDAATCKAFNDAGGENKSQAQTNPQKARPPVKWAARCLMTLALFLDHRELGGCYLTIPSTRSPMIGSLNFSC